MYTRAGRYEYIIFKLPPELGKSAGLGGWAGCATTTHGVCRVSLPQPNCDAVLAAFATPPRSVLRWTPVLCRAYRQIVQFLRGHRRAFALPVDLSGLSDFAVEVLSRLRGIGYGQTCSYQDIAVSVGRPRASRAVGRVMAANPVPLLLPCHRVIGSGGGLVGFGGGLPQKAALIELEASRSETCGVGRPTAPRFRVG